MRPSNLDRALRYVDAALDRLGDVQASGPALIALDVVYTDLVMALSLLEHMDAARAKSNGVDRVH